MNRSRTADASRLQPRMFAVIAVALLLLSLVAPAIAAPVETERPRQQAVCENLGVPSNSKLAFRVYAEGVQVYEWKSTGWSFIGPSAVLYADDAGKGAVGIHYPGPTWQSMSGGKVFGAVLAACTPDPNAIPWLLLAATADDGPGIFHRVTFIQRVNTVGGKAPAYAGSVVGEVAHVPYTAEYYFYRVR